MSAADWTMSNAASEAPKEEEVREHISDEE